MDGVGNHNKGKDFVCFLVAQLIYNYGMSVILLHHHRSPDTAEMDGVENHNKGKIF